MREIRNDVFLTGAEAGIQPERVELLRRQYIEEAKKRGAKDDGDGELDWADAIYDQVDGGRDGVS